MTSLISRLSKDGDITKLTGFFLSVVVVYLALVAVLILAQVERSVDRLSLSRTYLTGQRLAQLLARASGNWLNLAEIPDLAIKVEEGLLTDSEISAIVILRPDGSKLASTGSTELVSSIPEEWGRSAMRRFALQGGHQPFVVRVASVEYCAVAARNISGETVAIVWLIRQREAARKSIETAFNAITHATILFVLPATILASMFWWLGIKWYAMKVQKNMLATTDSTAIGTHNTKNSHQCDTKHLNAGI